MMEEVSIAHVVTRAVHQVNPATMPRNGWETKPAFGNLDINESSGPLMGITNLPGALFTLYPNHTLYFIII
jgi:hypothetical protein